MTKLVEKAIASMRQLSESEQERIATLILQEIEKKQVVDWDNFDEIVQESEVSTGIADLSHQHDHYIHGTEKNID